jgi:hypothetical protein
MGTTPNATYLPAIVRILFAALALTVLCLWGIAYWTVDDPKILQRDWYCLWSAGDAFRSGQWEGIYSQVFSPGAHDGVCAEGYFWLYPPYALYLAAIPALLPVSMLYPLVMGAVLGCFGGFLWIVHKFYPDPQLDFPTFALGAFAFAPLHTVLITGQNSAWGLLALTGGLLALQRQRLMLAACCIAILGLKPNWIILFLVWLSLRGLWRVVGGIAAAGALMLLSTAPLGLEIWWEFQQSTVGYGRYVLAHYPVDKLITSHALLRTFLEASGPLFYGLWALLLGGVLWSCWVTWRSERSLMAQASITVLATISCNVYTNFYDALFLLIPAALWWFERDRYSPRLWGLIGLMIAGIWAWTWLNYFMMSGEAPGHLGLFIVTWAVAEGFQSLRLSPSSQMSR